MSHGSATPSRKPRTATRRRKVEASMEAEKLLLTALAPPLSLRRDGNLARRLTDR
jgi:hypothetical protein